MTRSPGCGEAEADGEHRRARRLDACGSEVGQRDGAVALGEAGAVGAEHERHVGVGRHRQAEQPRDEHLARRRVEQVVAPHDLLDALVGVVDHDGHVVGADAVVAAQHEVVDGER